MESKTHRCSCKYTKKSSNPLDRKIKEWLAWDKNEETREEIQDLKDAEDRVHLKELLFSRVKFGTAGIRVKMGAGFNRINELVIIQTAQGLCRFIEDQFPQTCRSTGIVIGYDNRHNSQRFAELTAAIFLNQNMPVYLFSRVCPTPLISFAVLQFKCVAGVMITASHNPKDYNGVKVCWDNGAPMRPRDEKRIRNVIENNLVPWEKSWDTSVLQESPLLKDPLQEVENSYFSMISKTSMFPDLNKNSSIRFTYTPLHGVGYQYMLKAFEAAQLKPFFDVEEQRDPDPDFPTVMYPNPEEGEDLLDLACQIADENDSTIILVTDPDADKLGVAEKLDDGEWQMFTGNELGALLGWWMLFRHKQNNPNTPMEDVYMLSSTVSSKILESMAKIEGFNFRETLTGFKWLANEATDLVKEGKTVLYAFEESMGYMCGMDVPGKDAVLAGFHLAELATYLGNDHMTLRKKLEDIYLEYGQHINRESYFICYEPATFKRIFDKLSYHRGEPCTYPVGILNGKYKVIGVRDLGRRFDSNEPDLKPKLPPPTSSYMITFTFGNGLVATLRTSGTEPKLKYYGELRSKPGEKNMEELRRVKKEMLDAIVNEFVEPNLNGLIPKQ